jgi:hypothetical protein
MVDWAPLLRVLQVAASADPELTALWSEIAERRVRKICGCLSTTWT